MTRRKPSGISWITSTSKPEHTKQDFTLIVPDHSPTELYSKPSLKTVLNVLRIANKYCAANIEKVAASIAEKLTGSNLASHLSEKLTHIDVFRTGNTVENAKVTKHAWRLSLDDLRAGKLSARSFLDAARHSQDANFLVSAYYQIMLRGVRSWEKDQDLSNDECRRLTRGFARCCEEWDAFVSRLSVGDFDIPQYLLPKQNINEIGDGVSDQGINVLTDVSSKNKTTPTRNLYEIVEVMARQHTEKGLRCWDIIGRLKAMEHLKLPWNWNVYKDELGKCCEGTLSIIETSCLASFFLLDAHNGSEDN